MTASGRGAARQRIAHILFRHIKDDKVALSLVEGPVEALVEDHVGQLGLNALPRQVDELSDVVELDAGEGLDQANEVLLKQLLMQPSEVALNEDVSLQLCVCGRLGETRRASTGAGGRTLPELPERGFEELEGALLVRARDGTHGVDVPALVVDRVLAAENAGDFGGLGGECVSRTPRSRPRPRRAPCQS